MASIRKRPGRTKPWEARWRDPEGKSRSQSFARKSDAARFLAKIEHELLTGEYIGPAAGKVTFKTCAEEWRQAQVHRVTSAGRVESILRLHAYPAFGDRPIGSIRPSELQAWVKALSAELAPSTIAVAHGVVASVFKAAVRDRRVASNPCEGTKLPADHREPVVPLEIEQVRALEAAVPERFRALVPLGAATGPRISEALGLTVDRSGLSPPSARPTLRIDRQLVLVTGEPPYLGPPKRRASRREIPLPHVAVETLAAHLAAFPPTPREVVCRDAAGREWRETVEFVFTNERSGPIRRSRFSEVWRQAVKDAGLPESTTYHDLRHFYASLLIRYGESVKVVQARLGHATAAETLDTYSHLWPDSEDRTRAAVDSVLAAGVGQSWAAGGSL